MSNSPLVSYTKISPNRTSPRKNKIDTITIHCVVGQLSVESLGAGFALPSRGASSNYGVGTDGRIGMYVEEGDRSWCSGGRDGNGKEILVNGISGSMNDHRAITIEVASDSKYPYAINDKAYAGLVKLLVDICKRNGIPKLLWEEDKNLVGNISRQNMTVHRWFAYTACPGDYIYERLGQIANEVNAKLGNTITENKQEIFTPVVSSESLIYEWLRKNTSFNIAAISGILINLDHESGFKSNNLQDTFNKSLGYTDAEYTQAVDSGEYDNFIEDKAGYGLAQWTYHTRKKGLLELAQSKKVSISDYAMQMEFLIKELRSFKSLWELLTTTPNTVEGAYKCGYQFCYDFEAPANKEERSATRGEAAKKYFDKYVNSTTPPATEDKVEKPVIPSSSKYNLINVGDILNFVGSQQYTSAQAMRGIDASPTKVKVTKKYLETSRHPIHARAVNDAGAFISGVYGWVDLDDLEIGGTQNENNSSSTPTTSDTPYLVKVTTYSLAYRSGPSTDYPVRGTIRDKGIYTIVQEKNGWGKLKSGVGWISLKYTKRI